MTNPLEELSNDHRLIEKVLTALESAGGSVMPRNFYAKAVAFITGFADGCHHSKEEAHLFPMLERRGIPHEHGPLGVMEEEHEQGRKFVAEIRELLTVDDREGLRKATLAYAALMRGHIEKEDNALFPMAHGVLSDEDFQELQEQFDRISTAGRCSELYEPIAEELLAEANLSISGK